MYWSTLTLILLTWGIWWATNNVSNWQMGLNSPFKGLMYVCISFLLALQSPLGIVFYSPLVGFSFLAYEVSWSHTTTATVGRTSLNEWSVRCRDLYLTRHNTHNRQISMPRVGFEPTISVGERPKTYALDRAASGTGVRLYSCCKLT